MVVVLPVIKACARLGVTAILGLALVVPALPASAASPHFQFGQRGGNSDNRSPFNMDSDPCGAQSNGRRHNQTCPQDRLQLPRGEHGPREPGSSAFGLQFNSDGE